jgi:thioredoxin-like negative regulator of GroEL
MSYRGQLIRMSLVVTALLAAAPGRVFAATASAPRDYYDDAVKAFQQGDYRSALQLAKNSATTAPDPAMYHALVIQSLFALKDYDAATAQIRDVAESGVWISWQTLSHYYNDHVKPYTDQMEALAALVDEQPMDAGARLLLGYQYMIMGKSDLAHQQFGHVVGLSPFDEFAAKLYHDLTP